MDEPKRRKSEAASLQPAPRWKPTLWAALLPVPALAFIFLDERSIRMDGHWPDVLVTFAGLTSDLVTLIPAMSALAFFTGIALALHAATVGGKGLYTMACVLVASGITHALKPLIGRARPTVFDEHGLFGRKALDGAFDYVSFPSGHATHAGALFAALAFCFPKYRLVFLVLALWFAMSRILLGVHYPSDVAAGLLIGFGTAFLMARLAAKRGLVFLQQ